MSNLTLTKTKLFAGTWEGILSGVKGDTAPSLIFRHQDRDLEGLSVEKVDGDWYVQAKIPPELIADGVQVFVIADEAQNILADFTLIAGEALAEDIRAEMELLREELDMLKRAFRRHCLETA